MSVLKIRCSDQLLVEVEVEAAKKLGTLKNMLAASQFQADHQLSLENVSSKSLEKIVRFIKTPSDALDQEEFFGSDSIKTLDLMISANFLNVPQLLDAASAFLATKIKAELSDTECTTTGYSKEDICLKCRMPESQKQLKTCKKCLLATYCGKECQIADWSEHKAVCKGIKADAVSTEKEFNLLRQEEDMENAFEDHVGHFWGILETRDYCRARRDLAMKTHKLAKTTKSPKALKAAVDNMLDLLRLIHSDNLGLRGVVPFLMLDQDRDDDAYNFVKWWTTIDPDGRYDWGQVPRSQPGEWLYLRDQDVKEDLLIRPGKKDFHVQLAHLATIILIKARLISKAQEINLKGEAALQKLLEESGRSHGQVELPLHAIRNHLALLSDQELKRQNALVDKYLQKLLSMNHILAKAVINPDPLLSREPPHYMSAGSPEEAYSVLDFSLHLFQANALLMSKISQLVGPSPSYPTRGDLYRDLP